MKRDYTNYIVDSNGCWIYQRRPWRSKVHSYGYGPYKAFYNKYKGDVPKGLCIMHTCDNKNCVNPKHLILGSQADNGHDASGEGQTKKLLLGLIKEKHFAGAHRLYYERKEITKKLLSLGL